MKELSADSQSCPLSMRLQEKQPLLVAKHPTDCKVNKAENKVDEYEDDGGWN